MIAGEGGFLGPDLTAYGSERSAQEILKALVDSARIIPPGYKPAALTTHAGVRMEGIVRNEDNFSVQLQTQDGSFHFFQKTDLQGFEYLNRSFMPSDYEKRLTSTEVEDLISYLMSASTPVSSAQNSKRHPGTTE